MAGQRRWIRRLADLTIVGWLVGCATAPPAPRPWRPDPGPELEHTCQQAPVTCRVTAEKLASSWTTDDEAFGALKAFTAACNAGDALSCSAVDTRFKRPRYVGASTAGGHPVPHPSDPPSAIWVATCDISREGKVTACIPEPSNPALDAHLLQYVEARLAGPYSAPTLDDRPFGCRYQFRFELWRH